MSWVLVVRLIAITGSLAFPVAGLSIAQDVEIVGDCNVVAPSDAPSGGVSYTINCNNISDVAGDQIERILRLIEETSQNTPSSELEDVLSVLVRNSEANLEEIRKTRSPHIVLAKRIFDGCERDESYSCFDAIELVNDGGFIDRVEDLEVIETVYVSYESGTVLSDRGELQCPFGNYGPFESAGMLIDYEKSGYSFAGGESRGTGEHVGSIHMSNRYSGHRWFKERVIANYNEQRLIKLGDTVDAELLRMCLDFTFQLGVKVSLRNYAGSPYEQFFVLDYEKVDEELVEVVDAPFQQGPKGYEEFSAGYVAAKDSRKTDTGEYVNHSVIARFLLGRSL